MPKSQSKTKPKNAKPKNARGKNQPKQPGITSRKSYWAVLTLLMVAFGIFFGFSEKVSSPAIVMLLASVLSIIGFAYYLNFSVSTVSPIRRAVFNFAGASIIGFGIWAATVITLGKAGLTPQIGGAIGTGFFAITSLIICLAAGAFIGDQIGKNEEHISVVLRDKLRF